MIGDTNLLKSIKIQMLQSGALSLVEIRRNTVLLLVEPYYSGAKEVCCYGIISDPSTERILL